jgi:hypothetical protein
VVSISVGPDITEVIPLLDLDVPSGVYKQGRNTIDEFRQLFLGGFVGKTGSNPFTNKPGIFAVTNDSAGSWGDAAVYATGTPGNQTVNCNSFRAIINRTGHGAYLAAQSATLNVAAPAADAAQPRKDLFCIMPYDKQATAGADAQHGGKIIWVVGDASGSPAEPALPAAVSDALVLALVNRGANDNTIAPADIVPRQSAVSVHGVPRPLMAGDLITDNGRHHGELRAQNKDFIPAAFVTRGHTMWYDYWDAPSASWKGTNRPSFQGSSRPAGNGTLTTTEQMDLSVTFNAVAGHTYHARVGYGHSAGTNGADILVAPRVAAGASVGTGSTAFDSTRVFNSDTGFNWSSFDCEWIAPTTGQYTIGMGVYVFAGGTSGTVYGTSAGNARYLSIFDDEF